MNALSCNFPEPSALAVASDVVLSITGLYSNVSNAFANTATVTATLSYAGTTCATVTLVYVSASNGNYTAVIDKDDISPALVANRQYRLVVAAVQGSDEGEFEKLLIARDATGAYNWFGADPEDIVRLYPGVRLRDFGTGDEQADLSVVMREMDDATRLVLANCRRDMFQLLTRVEADLVVESATAAQTVFYLPFPSAKTSPLAIYKNWTLCPQLPTADDAMDASEYTVSRVTPTGTTLDGLVKITLGTALTEGDTIHATYDLDPTATTYAVDELADIVVKLAGASLGHRIYATQNDEWSLVGRYREEAEGRLKMLREGSIIPAALRARPLCADFDTGGDKAFSTVRWYRA